MEEPARPEHILAAVPQSPPAEGLLGVLLIWSTTTQYNRTGPDRTSQDQTEPDRTGQDRTGPSRTGQNCTGQDRTEQNRTGAATIRRRAGNRMGGI